MMNSTKEPQRASRRRSALVDRTPGFALFGIGDIVFDTASYASLVSQLTTLQTQYMATWQRDAEHRKEDEAFRKKVEDEKKKYNSATGNESKTWKSYLP